MVATEKTTPQTWWGHIKDLFWVLLVIQVIEVAYLYTLGFLVGGW